MKTPPLCYSALYSREAGAKRALTTARFVVADTARDGHSNYRSRSDYGYGRCIFALCLIFVVFLISPVLGQQTHGPVIVGAPVTPIKVTVKPAAAGQAAPAMEVDAKTVPEGEPLPTVAPPPHRPIVDPVFQKPLPKVPQKRGAPGLTEAVSAPIVNVPGITSASNPPDTTGDVGPNHYIQMVNATRFQIFDKAGAPLTPATLFGSLWTPATGNAGDPIVVYDHLADRWVLTQFFSGGMYFAVSQTSDPTAGTWFLYEFNTSTGLPDYPKIGVWPDAFYMSTYESGLGIYAFDRVKMLAGLPAGFVKTTISVLTPSPGIRDTRILPVDLDGPPPPAGTPGYFVRTVDSQQDISNPTDRIEIYEAIVNWTGPTLSFPLVNTLTPAAFNTMVGNRNGGGIRDMIPQPNTTATMDSLSNRPMMQLKYRNFGSNSKMVFCQTIDISGSIPALLGFTPTEEVAGIRWYQLDKSGANWTIDQQGTFGDQPPGATNESQLLHRWMGSAAMNGGGDLAIGYSITNDDDTNPIFPGIRYTGRVASDPAGTLPQGEGVILNGTSSKGANGAYGQRWGDYSQMGVDPSDDSTFWFTTHDATGATRIASFTVSLPAGPEILVEEPAGNALLDAVSIRNFGVLPPGGNATLTFTIRNLGSVDLTGLSVSKDGADSADFTVGSLGATTLATGASTTFTVTFTPSALGVRDAAIHIASNDPDENPFDIALVGTAAFQEIAVEQPAGTGLVDGAATRDYGFVNVGSSVALTFTVRNLGGADLTGLSVTKSGANSADFTLGSLGATTLPAGGSTTFMVTFVPGAQGVRNAAIHIASNDTDENPFDIALTGTGFVPEIAVEQPEGTNLTDGVSTVAFGNVLVGAVSVKRFAIKNASIGPLTVSSANVNGANAAEFSLGALSATSVPAGGTAYLDVTFSPLSAAAKSAALHILSTDPDESSFDIALTGAGTTLGGPISLLRDINRTSNGLLPGQPVVVGSLAFFTGTTVNEGTELWRSDGTAAGTFLVKDILVGTGSSGISSLTSFNGALYFAANNSTNGQELWKSDGTAAGTVLVKDIFTGTGFSSPANFMVIGATLYFTATDAANGNELWKSDGTTAGTVPVANIASGTTSSSPANLRNVNGTLFFTANDAVTGVELWKSDGTAAGTVPVKDIVVGPANSSPTNLNALGSTLIFTVNDGVNGIELWSSDGTSTGTAILRNINPGSASSSPANFVTFGGALYFTATTATEGTELWKTDGTVADTTLVKDIYAGTLSSAPTSLTVIGSTLYFSAFEATNGREPWKSDGTTAGTVLLRDIASGSFSSSPTLFTEAGGSVYFAATGNGLSDRELWKTDGTAAGTVRVKDINPGLAGSGPASFVNLAGTLIFSANDGIFGQELWKSDGTSGGTVMIFEAQTGSSSAAVVNLRAVNGILFFSANDGINGQELWKSNGTLAGTVMVSNIAAGLTSSSPANFTNIGSTLYFSAFDTTNGTELWKSDGTAAGTVLVANVAATTSSSSPTLLTPVGSTLFFSANDLTNGAELWKSDGTAAGTTMVLNIHPTAAVGSSLANLTSFNGALFFSANDGVNGQELWKSDGTAGGTVLVRDINAGSVSSSPANLRVIGSRLFFTATTAANGIELWVTDGTTAGTVLVADILAGTGSSAPLNLTAVGSTLFFSATTAATGRELFKSDGTAAGTVLVKDIWSGTTSSSPSSLINVNGGLFFGASDSALGFELHKSDGTSAGTVLVKDIHIGTGNSAFLNPVLTGSEIYFSAFSLAEGNELWKSDGTAAGTTLVADLMQGATSSSPANLTVVGNLLFFTARGPELGLSELFVVQTSPPPEIVVEQPAGTSLVDGTSAVNFGLVAVGSNASRQFTIRNTGAGNLAVFGISVDGINPGDFTVTASPASPVISGGSTTFTVQFAPTAAGVRTASLHLASDDADENPFDIILTGIPVQTIGPDAFGYVATNDLPFSFMDISTIGTVILDGVDDSSVNVPVGFNFAFYGTAYSSVYVSSNALLTFGAGNTTYTNTNLTTRTVGQPVIAALWDDWVTYASATDKVYYATSGVAGSRIFTVQWNVTPISGGGEAVFQCLVFEATGQVRLNYLDVQTGTSASNGGASTIGIQDLGGNANGRVLQWSFNTQSVADGTSILFSPPAPEIAVEEPAGTGLSDGLSTTNFGSVTLGTNAVRTFTIRNLGTAALTGLSLSKDGSHNAEFALGSLGVTTLSPGASATFAVTFSPSAAGGRNAALHIASSDLDENPFDVALTGLGLTRLEAWRLQHFGSAANSGSGADGNDFDFDGMPNFLEFCLKTDPQQPSQPGQSLIKNGTNLEFTYTRAKAAVLDGVVFTVEWIENLTLTNWSAVGVSEWILNDDGVTQVVKATLPAGTSGRRFVRLNAKDF